MLWCRASWVKRLPFSKIGEYGEGRDRPLGRVWHFSQMKNTLLLNFHNQLNDFLVN